MTGPADPGTPVVTHFALREGAEVHERDGRLAVAAPGSARSLGALGPGARRALELLAGGASEHELAAAVSAAEGSAGLLSWARALLLLKEGNWLVQELREQPGSTDGRPEEETLVARLVPVGFAPPATAQAAAAPPPLAFPVLSRFTLLRREGERLVVESPRARALAVLEPRAAALVAQLTGERPLEAVVSSAALSPGTARRLLVLLAEAGLVVLEPVAVEKEETTGRALAQWSVPDLYFHARSRLGRHVGGYGGTYPLLGRFDPLPAHVAGTGPYEELEAPAVASPLDALLEARTSVRAHDDANPIGRRALGELLYRCGRLRDVRATEMGEVASRPYPSGGSLYELEIYPVVRHCTGLEPGVYRYDGARHGLYLLAPPGPKVTRLLELSRLTAAMEQPPQVLLVVTARFGRVMWKYTSIAYALVLKHVGVLYQTLYLVATEMGLAPCALGGGDSDLFGEIAGLEFEEESSVGEFVIGSRRPPE